MNRKNINRKTLSIVLCLVVVSVFTLTIAYAALNAVLTIQGNAEVIASTWNIYLDNAILSPGSEDVYDPTITGTNKVEFETTLDQPGEFYEFTVDVVNAGTIDAMIASVIKTPELTTDQAKFLKYEVTYENGEPITTKQTLSKGTTTPIKVRIEYRKDLVASDLPTAQTVLDMSITLEYTQSDGTGSGVINNGKNIVNIISGDYDTVGSEICIGEECFYVISSTTNTVTMFAKYNLHVGNEVLSWNIETGESTINPLANPTGKQDKTAIGTTVNYYFDDENEYFEPVLPSVGTITFSDTAYWSIDSDPYVYNENSNLYKYVENYKFYLESLNVNIEEARLISWDELVQLGCPDNGGFCYDAPKWVYSSSYWTGSSCGDDLMCSMYNFISFGEFGNRDYYDLYFHGVRPVIVISKDYFN